MYLFTPLQVDWKVLRAQQPMVTPLHPPQTVTPVEPCVQRMSKKFVRLFVWQIGLTLHCGRFLVGKILGM
jgi:hypothetical protein